MLGPYRIISVTSSFSTEYGYVSDGMLKGIGSSVPAPKNLEVVDFMTARLKEVGSFTVEELLTSSIIRLRELRQRILSDERE